MCNKNKRSCPKKSTPAGIEALRGGWGRGGKATGWDTYPEFVGRHLPVQEG